MSPELFGVISFVVLLILMALNMPIHAAFALLGFYGYSYLAGWHSGLPLLGLVPYSWASNYVLVTVPMFILMGLLVFYSGVSRELFDVAYKWLGRLPGGLAMATTFACALFGACTGSSTAATATMGTMCLPEMLKHNYDRKLATGAVAAGGTLAIMIPPSTIFIIYGVLTETSVGRLFIAGIIPGILITVALVSMIYVRVRANPKLAPLMNDSYSLKEKLVSLRNLWGMVILFALVIGGLFVGIFTPTEAGAVGAFGALLIALSRKQLTWHRLVEALSETGRITTMVICIIIGAMIYNNVMAISGLALKLSQSIQALAIPPYAIISIILIVYVPLGMFMDSLAMLILTLPIFFPLVTKTLGFDPIWFGVLVTLEIEIALITPPVGMNVYVLCGMRKDIPMEEIFLGIVPYVTTMFVVLAILAAFPQISLVLPNLMMGK